MDDGADDVVNVVDVVDLEDLEDCEDHDDKNVQCTSPNLWGETKFILQLRKGGLVAKEEEEVETETEEMVPTRGPETQTSGIGPTLGMRGCSPAKNQWIVCF